VLAADAVNQTTPGVVRILGVSSARFDQRFAPLADDAPFFPVARADQTVPASHKLIGFMFQVRLDVPPGACQLRIAGRDVGSGTVGSLLYDLDVPDFFGTPLSMSGVALTGEEAGLVPSPKPDPIIEKLLPGTPVTQRVFSSTDIVTALVEVYDNQRGGPAHTVYIATSVTTEDGKVLFREEASRPSADLKGGRGAFGHTVKIPLRDLGAGAFILKIEARSSLGTTTVVSRETPFRVR